MIDFIDVARAQRKDSSSVNQPYNANEYAELTRDAYCMWNGQIKVTLNPNISNPKP